MDFTDLEKDFINRVKKLFLNHNGKYKIQVQKLSGNVLNFNLNGSQVGRIKLQGKKTEMQVLIENKFTQEDLNFIQEAIKKSNNPMVIISTYKRENKFTEVKWFVNLAYEEYVSMIPLWLEYPDNFVYNSIIEMKVANIPFYQNPFTDELIRF